ncbi:hypothetical protein PMAYCL1PPCAC_18439, partial [Pristionchus mayeri]
MCITKERNGKMDDEKEESKSTASTLSSSSSLVRLPLLEIADDGSPVLPTLPHKLSVHPRDGEHLECLRSTLPPVLQHESHEFDDHNSAVMGVLLLGTGDLVKTRLRPGGTQMTSCCMHYHFCVFSIRTIERVEVGEPIPFLVVDEKRPERIRK